MAIDAEVGGSSANSYVSIADADTFFEVRSYASAWTSASDENKEASLVQATRVANVSYDFLGSISTQAQALRWPRSSVYDQDGRLYADDELPKLLTDAICDYALYILQSDLLADDGANLIDEMEIGPIRLDFDKSKEKELIPSIVHDQLMLLSENRSNLSQGVVSMPVTRT